MKRLSLYMLTGAIMLITSCSDFLDTIPNDALSPATTWQTDDDAEKFAVGCYNDWLNGEHILYWDCGSDIGYNNFPWEGWTVIGNGSLTPANYGTSFYDFTTIRRCLTFLENVEQVTFTNEAKKKDLIAQVRAIRAYSYFQLNFWYGGVPLVELYASADEAKAPRETEAKVKEFIYSEIDAAIADINPTPSARGRVAKGAALAIKMRSALYWEDYDRAKKAAEDIISLGQYELDPNYADLFTLAGQNSKELILAAQYLETLREQYIIGQMYNNADGGWSSIVPTVNLVDMYEMEDGLTKEESTAYNPVHPFKGRDPRMAMTILFPGQDWLGETLNTLDETIDGSKNDNYTQIADNASKTGLTWAKYLAPMEQYGDIWNTSACPVVFRYADVLLTYAEATNELSGPSGEVYDALDQIRTRAGMPLVDRSKYGTKEKLRELIRRERTVELAGEGLRRADIVRWKDANGKMLAETVMNGVLERIVGTINYNETDPYLKATIDVSAADSDRKIEDRKFEAHNRYLPIPQDSRDKNPQLEQNTGY
jgi:hypothetical protein